MDLLHKIRYIFTKQQKRKFVGLFFILFFGALLEMIGVSLIMPFVEIVSDPNAISNSKTYSLLYEILEMQSTSEFLIMLSFALVAMYIIKNAYLIGMNFIQIRFLSNSQLSLCKRLMDCYMKKPYSFHLQKNSAELIRIINTDTSNLFNLILAVMSILSEILVSGMLCIFLFVKDPVIMTVVVALMGFFSLFYYQIIKKKISQFGIFNQIYSAKMIKCINQSFGGIKEVKILHREQYFIDEYAQNGTKQIGYSRTNSILAMLPRYILETICISGVLTVIAVKLNAGAETTSIIGQLTAFAVAAYRLLPAVNRMNTYINTITYLKPSINLIYEDLKETEGMEQVLKEWENEPVYGGELNGANKPESIDIEHVTFHYADAEPDDTVVRDVSFKIQMGKATAFIGASGAGKTTMADIILGVLEPTKGEVKYGGMNVHHHRAEWSKRLGYIPQSIYLADDSIRKNVAFGVEENEIDDAMVWQALEKAQLRGFVESLEEGLDSVIGEQGARISGGQRQRIGIARALYHNPEILVLDEATSALDNDTETAVMEAIDNLAGEKTLLIIAHRLSTIRNCQYVYKIENNCVTEIKAEKSF